MIDYIMDRYLGVVMVWKMEIIEGIQMVDYNGMWILGKKIFVGIIIQQKKNVKKCIVIFFMKKKLQIIQNFFYIDIFCVLKYVFVFSQFLIMFYRENKGVNKIN